MGANMFFMNAVLAGYFWIGSVIINYYKGTIDPGAIF